LYNKFIIIITAENKEKYLLDTINSCLKQLNKLNTKIYVVYSKLSNVDILKHKFIKNKKIIFIKSVIKKKLPTQDQLFKIEIILKYLKNEWILLLDGDDLFKSSKIEILNKLKLNKNTIYLNNHEKIFGKKVNIENEKRYKKNFLFRKFFNDWPQKINTSSIIVSANLLKKFYKNNNPYKWKYLAIDVQIILYYYYKKKFKFLNQILTSKKENINNLDKTFSGLKNRNYWNRRFEQHVLTKILSNKNNYIDRFLTYIFRKIF
tara:strand:+ start:74 stop:859 length:786 start_codon:yes stop_codon:yes gene_type:complete